MKGELHYFNDAALAERLNKAHVAGQAEVFAGLQAAGLIRGDTRTLSDAIRELDARLADARRQGEALARLDA